jgi:hypothetical protein
MDAGTNKTTNNKANTDMSNNDCEAHTIYNKEGETESAAPNGKRDLPTYDAFSNGYPLNEDCATQMSVPDVCAMIGGVVNDMYEDKPSSFGGACALRVSIALGNAGIEIPAIEGTAKGANGKNYFLSAVKMNSWMTSTFGKPDISLSRSSYTEALNEGRLNGNKGIYFMLPISTKDFMASGHATMYNGSSCIGKCFFDGAAKINLWILK